MGVTLYYNAACGDCRRQSKRASKLDWLRRVRISTDPSPIGQVPRGEIVVVDEESKKVYTGIYATRAICMRVRSTFFTVWRFTYRLYATCSLKANKDAMATRAKSDPSPPAFIHPPPLHPPLSPVVRDVVDIVIRDHIDDNSAIAYNTCPD